MKKLTLIDGTGLIYRGFYSIPPFLKSPEGILTNAVYGFALILLSIIETQKPDYITVAFDRKGPTFRHEQFAEYKATRTKAPDELYAQIPIVKDLVNVFCIPQFEAIGFEADDVIATITKKVRTDHPGVAVSIATGDFDMFQLAAEHVSILYPTKGFRGADVFTPENIKEKYSLTPSQVPDYKGLAGDSSDNIPGVRGIGDKTATDLLLSYGNLEGIYEHIDEIKGAKRTKLEAGKAAAFECRSLATLRYDVEVPFNLSDCHLSNVNGEAAYALFDKLGFRSLIGRLQEILGVAAYPKSGQTFTDENYGSDADEFDKLFGSNAEVKNTAITKTITTNNHTKNIPGNSSQDQQALF